MIITMRVINNHHHHGRPKETSQTQCAGPNMNDMPAFPNGFGRDVIWERQAGLVAGDGTGA